MIWNHFLLLVSSENSQTPSLTHTFISSQKHVLRAPFSFLLSGPPLSLYQSEERNVASDAVISPIPVLYV